MIEQAEAKTIENEAKACEIPSLPKRTSAKVIAEIAIENYELDEKINKLQKAIEIDPPHVSASQKTLWKSQLDSMKGYQTALKARIIDLLA